MVLKSKLIYEQLCYTHCAPLERGDWTYRPYRSARAKDTHVAPLGLGRIGIQCCYIHIAPLGFRWQLALLKRLPIEFQLGIGLLASPLLCSSVNLAIPHQSTAQQTFSLSSIRRAWRGKVHPIGRLPVRERRFWCHRLVKRH